MRIRFLFVVLAGGLLQCAVFNRLDSVSRHPGLGPLLKERTIALLPVDTTPFGRDDRYPLASQLRRAGLRIESLTLTDRQLRDAPGGSGLIRPASLPDEPMSPAELRRYRTVLGNRLLGVFYVYDYQRSRRDGYETVFRNGQTESVSVTESRASLRGELRIYDPVGEELVFRGKKTAVRLRRVRGGGCISVSPNINEGDLLQDVIAPFARRLGEIRGSVPGSALNR